MLIPSDLITALLKFGLSWFKGVKGVEGGALELDPFTVLLGANNSAKTTVLEALYLLQNPVSQTVFGTTPLELISELHSLLQSGSYPGKLLWLFNNYIAEEASISLDDKRLGFVRESEYIRIYYSSSQRAIPESTIEVEGKKLTRPWFARVSLDGTPPGEAFKEKFEVGEPLLFSPRLLERVLRSLTSRWTLITNMGLTAKIAEELSELSYENYTDFVYEPFMNGPNTLFAYTSDRRRIRLGDLGEGIKVYAVVRMMYEFMKPRLVLWDDAEAHLNPRVVSRVASWLAGLVDSGTTVVLATHSIELATSMLTVANRGSAVLLSLKDGTLKHRKLSLEEIEKLYEGGVDVRLAEGYLL